LLPYGAILLAARRLNKPSKAKLHFPLIGVREGHPVSNVGRGRRQSRDHYCSHQKNLPILAERAHLSTPRICTLSQTVFEVLGLDETADETRLRVCQLVLLARYRWRAHPELPAESKP